MMPVGSYGKTFERHLGENHKRSGYELNKLEIVDPNHVDNGLGESQMCCVENFDDSDLLGFDDDLHT